jgi:hypothetical protein
LNFKNFNLGNATLFVHKVGKTMVYLVLYIHDLLITWNNEIYIVSIKKDFKKYLGIEVIENTRYIFNSQMKYIGEFLNKFGMDECNPISTPIEKNLKLTSKEGNEFEDATKYIQLGGSLIYLTNIGPDISFVGIFSRFI